MAVRELLRMGDPRLYQVARPVSESDWSDLRALIQDMEDTMEAAEGTGLAAPQIGVPLRVVIFEVDGERAGDPSDSVPRTILINPTITILDAGLQTGLEGCLSVPGMRGWVDRYRAIRYTATNLDGQTISRDAKGFHATVIQHELDHLDGVLYPMRIADPKLFGFSGEIIAAAMQQGGADPCGPPSDDA